ncbi:hypothetical protein CON65_17370 [Bacillus pseudomycoides]|uniref:Uncharacterized protein n=1 Tax=Bacillus pseudomycoides TaxID=64104 RepID=A0AA91VAA6_9BACI|nr:MULTISPECIES: hypothetical protein [Bacillus]PEB54442.1 hypothetical protein COO03_05300 [Bacillus sp. AFS098217]PED81448.1 hypothetical protein CON65_17370 [Bacillus pseudomycoides]PEU06661.1 hypothetical protein CN524_22640 [Bacillus sp. AFS019443]
MKKRYLSKVALFALSTSILIPTTGSPVFAETQPTTTSKPTEEVIYDKEYQEKLNNMKPFIEAYDKKGNLIKSYSEEEIEQLQQEILAPDIYKQPETNGEPFTATYDENRNMISSSDTNLLNAHKSALEKVKAAGLTVYNYEPTQFGSSIYIGGGSGKLFSKPQSVVIDAKKKFSSMAVRVIQDGSEVGSIKVGGFLGGINVPISKFTSRGGQYKIQFQNLDPNGYTIFLNGGQVYY